MPKPNLTISKTSFLNFLKFTLILIFSGIASAFLTGFTSALSSNIQISGVTGQLAFDPLITIAYIILFHYAAHFASFPKSVTAKFFLLTLFLSFTINFIPGSLFLLIIIYLTKKLLLKSTQ